MGLYHRIVHGNTFYISDIERDAECGCLTLNFLGDPAQPDVVRVPTFTDVRDFSEQWDDPQMPEDETTQSLIGLEEALHSDGIHYEIILDEVVIKFTSRELPQVVDLIPFYPYDEQFALASAERTRPKNEL